jgi:hypothetical protein
MKNPLFRLIFPALALGVVPAESGGTPVASGLVDPNPTIVADRLNALGTTPAVSPSAGASAGVDPAIAKLIADIGHLPGVVQDVIAAYKKGGYVAALEAAVPALIEEVPQDIRDVTAALPALKTGFKTSEGILTIVSTVAAGVLVYFSPTISQGTAATVGIVGIGASVLYNLTRSFLKAATIKAATTVTTAALKP